MDNFESLLAGAHIMVGFLLSILFIYGGTIMKFSNTENLLCKNGIAHIENPFTCHGDESELKKLWVYW